MKFAQTITSAGNDLLSLINDVLDLSRIEAGKVELVPEIVSVAGTLEGLVKTFQPAAEQKGLRFSTPRGTGGARTHSNRSAAAGADSQEPAVECHQIYRQRRGDGARIYRRARDGMLCRAGHGRRHRQRINRT